MTLTKEDYEKVYALFDECGPAPFDCGALCGSVCCCSGKEDEELGIYLMPGEEQMLAGEENAGWIAWNEEPADDYLFPESWKGRLVPFVRCTTPPHCPRDKRPVQCRTFPLLPHLLKNGELLMILNDLDLPYRCPFLYREQAVSPDFVQNAKKAWQILMKDPLIYDLVVLDSEERMYIEPVESPDGAGSDS